MTKNFKAIKPPKADEPAAFDESIVAAMQAISTGTATAWQQKKALEWIINNASMAHVLPYRENDRDTSFACGRSFVGQQIIGVLRLNMIQFDIPPQTREEPKER